VTDAVPFHTGFAVADLTAATALHSGLGVERWVFSGWRTGAYFDAAAGGVVEPRSRVAYGRVGGESAVELIEVDPAGPVPVAWRLGSGHLGHWVRDTGPVARRLLRAGGRIVLARAASAGVRALTAESAADPEQVPDGLDACYVLTGTGQLIELVPAAIWSGRLVTGFGPDTLEVIPRPPDRLLAG
jgi:catechol 2,3-dioxygenase-like lactoylglutathione lyase family enzyme